MTEGVRWAIRGDVFVGKHISSSVPQALHTSSSPCGRMQDESRMLFGHSLTHSLVSHPKLGFVRNAHPLISCRTPVTSANAMCSVTRLSIRVSVGSIATRAVHIWDTCVMKTRSSSERTQQSERESCFEFSKLVDR